MGIARMEIGDVIEARAKKWQARNGTHKHNANTQYQTTGRGAYEVLVCARLAYFGMKQKHMELAYTQTVFIW